ncbi:hypothetical protein BJV74DRAFT_83550 [Russula compacta]|nr:hypothetical protein BJV74DRAFT_83550 [Russula compacta]
MRFLEQAKALLATTTTMNSGFFDTNEECTIKSQSVCALERTASSPAAFQSSVSLSDSCTSRTSTSRPRLTRGEQHTPDSCTSQCPSIALSTPAQLDVAFADRNSGVIFSGLLKASGERVTTQEFRKTNTLAPTLHLVIPFSPFPALAPAAATDTAKKEQEHVSTSEDDEPENVCPLPSFSLTLATPISPRSPVHPPSPPTPFTHASYYAMAARAPPNARVPYLPQYCPHTLRPFVPLSSCKSCALQLLACDTWWCSRGPEHGKATLRAPPVPPACSTPTTRAIHYALGIPLGEFDPSCVDRDVVEDIMFIPRVAASRRGKKPVIRAPSRIRMLFRRARYLLTASARVPMVPMPTLVGRRAIVRP